MTSAFTSLRLPQNAEEQRPRLGPHVLVGSVPVFDGGLEQSARIILDGVVAGRGARVATANMDFLAIARRDAALRADLQNSDLVVADGAPVAWMARLGGARQTRRVAGVDLVRTLFAQAPEGTRVAFYGSTPELTEKAAAVLEAEGSGAKVVARCSPPFRPMTDAEHAAELAPIVAAEPHIVLVALGCPRQERLIAMHAHLLPGTAWVGVGGTFDFFAGRRKRAPRAVQVAGFEWAVRLAQEPGRLWRRYLLADLPELVRLVPGVVAGRRVRVSP